MTDDQQDESAPSDAGKHTWLPELIDYEFPERLLADGRERGLSKTDRRFLVTGKTSTGTPSESVRSNTHTRIRGRIRETIIDFWLISAYLSEHDRDLIFGERSVMEDWEMREGIKNAMQFFYTGLDGSDLMDFEMALKSAIHDAEKERRQAERDLHDGPVLVETDFDVTIREQFDVTEAYEEFQEGASLEPVEVGALLTTGRVNDPAEVQRLAKHAREHGMVESSVSPLTAQELSDVFGGPPTERIFSTLAHLPDTEAPADAGEEPFQGQDVLDAEPLGEDERPATPDDLPNADIDDDAEIPDESDGGPDTGREADLRELSADLDEPITVGDEVVYEDGDRHVVERDDDDGDTLADADR